MKWAHRLRRRFIDSDIFTWTTISIEVSVVAPESTNKRSAFLDHFADNTARSNVTQKRRPAASNMVSNMNIEPRTEICDINRPTLTNSAISENTIECQLTNGMADTDEITKRVLNLDLSQRSDTEKGSFDADEKSSQLDDNKSPKSPSATIRKYSSFAIFSGEC